MERVIQRLTIVPGDDHVHASVAISAIAADDTAIAGPPADIQCKDENVLDLANSLLDAYSGWLDAQEAEKPSAKRVPIAIPKMLEPKPDEPIEAEGPIDKASGLADGMVAEPK